MTVVMRVEIEGAQVDALRILAIKNKTTVPRLIAAALQRDKVTKQAFAKDGDDA